MNVNKKRVLILVVLLSFTLLVGCFNNQKKSTLPNEAKQELSKGILKVQVEIPQQLKLQSQEIVASGQLTITSLECVLKQNESVESKVVNVLSNNVQIDFPELAVGSWQVEIYAKNSEGYSIYSGTNTAWIEADSMAKIEISLNPVPGGLDAQVEIPADLTVTSGEIRLEDFSGTQISQDLTISGTQGLANFAGLDPHTWPVEVELYNGSDSVGFGSGTVDILPGRTITANIALSIGSGNLIIDTSWNLPPEPPISIMGTWADGNAKISWESDSASSVMGYVVYRSTSEMGAKHLLTPSIISVTNYVDSSIVLGETYWYWIQAVSSDNLWSELSIPAIVVAGDTSSSNKYGIETAVFGSGIVIKTPDQDLYLDGSSVQLKAEPLQGYYFSHWEGSLTGNSNPVTIRVDGEKDIKAVFNKQIDKIATPVLLPNGGVFTEPQVIRVSCDTSEIAFLYTLDGSDPIYNNGQVLNGDFLHIQGELYLDHPATLKIMAYAFNDTMENSDIVTANFDFHYSLTVTTDLSQGSVDLKSPTNEFTGGEYAELSVIAQPGYRFSHWAGENGEDVLPYADGYRILMNDNKQITAVFTTNSIQTLIEQASDGDIITISPGVYYENLDFQGKIITLQSENPDDPNIVASTILDGRNRGPVVKFRSGETSDVALKGFTIRNGKGIPLEEYHCGGGIYITDSSSPTISKNVIEYNSADHGGGIFVADYSAPSITDNQIKHNSNDGVYIQENASPTLTNNMISNNEGTGIYIVGQSSGRITDNTIESNTDHGVYTDNASPVLENNKILNNTASYDGAGIYIKGDSVPEIRYNTIQGNSCMDEGGGVYVYEGNPIFEENIIEYNQAQDGAGMYLYYRATPQIINNQFRYNETTSPYIGNEKGVGGAIYIKCDSLIEGNTFEYNIASNGGALYIENSSNITIRNNTFNYNSASSNVSINGNGGSIYLTNINSCSIQSNHFTGNDAFDGGAIYLIRSSSANVYDNNFDENVAGEHGGAIYVSGTSKVLDSASSLLPTPDTFNSYTSNRPTDIYYESVHALVAE